MATPDFQSPTATRAFSRVNMTPRPTPSFGAENSFSHRRKTPFRAPRPPRPPTKSCPPVSRIFKSSDQNAVAHAVSFKTLGNPVMESPLYQTDSAQLYFEQCFEIRQKLGEGSFGEVYEVQSKENGKLYAVKRSAEKFKGALDRKKKLAEVEKHEKLAPHPNCVQFYRAWEERHRLYIQIELCLMSLAECADLHGRLGNAAATKFLVDLIKAVNHLHDHNLCHFDIKPANAFIDVSGAVCKLGDFGLVVASDDPESVASAQEGDPKYMAPELMKAVFGKPADIFSLGISMLELSCDLELPGNGPLWHQLRQGNLPEEFVQYLSAELCYVITAMMTPQPADRPSAAVLLRDQMYKITADLVQLDTRQFECIRRMSDAQPLTPSSGHRPIVVFSDEDDSLPIPSVSPLDLDQSEDSDSSCPQIDKSWLNDNPAAVFPSPVYIGPPIPLTFGESDGDDAMDESVLSVVLEDPFLVEEAQRTAISPFAVQEISFNKTPSECSLEVIKSLTVAPKNLMNAFSDDANQDVDVL